MSYNFKELYSAKGDSARHDSLMNMKKDSFRNDKVPIHEQVNKNIFPADIDINVSVKDTFDQDSFIGKPLKKEQELLDLKIPGIGLGTILDGIIKYQTRKNVETLESLSKISKEDITKAGGEVGNFINTLIGSPIDFLNASLGLLGVEVSDKPFLGRKSLNELAKDISTDVEQ